MEPRTQAERSEGTRTALVAAARELFAERGYGGTSTEEIVARAGLTRGALYHHFKGKGDLFFAVVDELEREIGERVVIAGQGPGDTWLGLLAGFEAYLEACTEPEVARIALDAPAVLGWETQRRLHEDYGVSILSFGIEAAMADGLIERAPVSPLAHMLLAATHEGALMIAGSADPQATKDEVARTIKQLLEGLRSR